jgi:hypothetical protein
MPVNWRVLILIFLTVFSACGGSDSGKPENRIPDAEDAGVAEVSIKVDRFEQDLFKSSKETFVGDTLKLMRKYKSFFPLFAVDIIRIGGPKNPMFRENLLGFVNDPDVRSVFEEVQKQYPDVNFIKDGVSPALNRYHVLFPDSVIPNLVTMVSGFNYNIAATDSSVAISLDLYLGEKCKFYELLAMPAYKVKNMHRGQIVTDVIRGFLLANHEMKYPTDDLISWMVYHGTINYVAMQLLPDVSEASIMAYDEAQLEWSRANEQKIWSHFIDQKLFYSTDFNNQVNYINDGPFTPGFTKETPPKMGVYLGLQLVKSYMEKHPDVTIPQLLSTKDAHKLFNESGYKPVKK